jgi:hypothetical protein
VAIKTDQPVTGDQLKQRLRDNAMDERAMEA